MNTLRRTFWLHCRALLLALALLTPALADQAQAPDKVLQERAQIILGEMKRDGGAVRHQPEKLRALVDKHLLPLIDFESMAKLVLGVEWKRASEAQRSQFTAVYKELLIRTYTKSIKEYANVDIRFFDNRTRSKDNYATVYSEFVPGAGKPNVPVEYSLRFKDDAWQVYDLTIEGLSLVKNYRTSFADEIKATSLDALIARLQKESATQG